MADTAETVFRDYVTDGVPASGKNKPQKSAIRRLLKYYETVISAFTSNGGLIYVSKASMDADLLHAAKSSAWVVGDATVANNGIYQKQGGSGSGSWTRVADLPYGFIIAADAGAGTANAIQATTSLPVSSSALVWMNVFEANTSSPVTVSFNGGSALTIKTNAGNNVAVGGLAAGMVVLGVISGSTFRLVSDQASAAVLAAAEAAAATSIAAAAAAVAAANAGFVFNTRAAVAAANVPAPLQFIRTAGYSLAGDGGAALYKRVVSEPSHPGKIQSLDGAWWEIAESVLNVKMFGAVMDATIVDTQAVRNAMAAAFVLNIRLVKIPGGIISFSGIDMTLYKGVSLLSDAQDSVYIVPDANNVTIFSDINPSAAGSNFTLGPFSVLCELGAIARTGVRGVYAVHSNRIVLDHIKFLGCQINFEFDQGGLHRIEGCVGAGTSTLKAGKVVWGSSVDTEYGAVFSYIDYRIDNSGTGVQSPAWKFRRAVAVHGVIVSNNSDYTGDCVVVENDCQGLDIRMLGTAYERSLVFQKGPGINAKPIFNTFRLEADQNGGTALVMTAGRQNDVDVMITSSLVATSATAVVLDGADVEYNKIHGRISGYYGTIGSGIALTNTVGTKLDLDISGCARGIVDGGGNTYCDIQGNVSDAVASKLVGTFANVGNRIHDLKGYSGSTAVGSPLVPASDTPVTNSFGHDVRVFLVGGTASILKINGQGTAYVSGMCIVLKPGETLAWVGTVAPAWYWIAF